MDNELAKITNPTSITAYQVKSSGNILVFPNPATDHLVFTIIAGTQSTMTIKIYNNLGVEVQCSKPYNLPEGSNSLVLPLTLSEQPGIYYYRIFDGDETAFSGRFIRIQ